MFKMIANTELGNIELTLDETDAKSIRESVKANKPVDVAGMTAQAGFVKMVTFANVGEETQG